MFALQEKLQSFSIKLTLPCFFLHIEKHFFRSLIMQYQNKIAFDSIHKVSKQIALHSIHLLGTLIACPSGF